MGRQNDIGPVYSFLGSVALLGAIGLYGYQVHIGHDVSKYDLIILLVLVTVCMALLRPKWLDGFVKTIGDRLPFIEFKKRDKDAGGLE